MTEELVNRARTGDQAALNQLIDNHKDLAYSVAFKYVQNKEDAEDVAQNALISVIKNIKKFRSEAKFSTWLYKIVYHECTKEFRRRKNIEYIPEFTKIPETTEPERSEHHPDIDKLLKDLKPLEYTVISLFYLKEKKIKEIALITQLSRANVKVILHRARKKLRTE